MTRSLLTPSLRVFAILSVVLILAVACGGTTTTGTESSTSAGGETRTLDMTMQNMSYAPDELNVNKGDHVVIHLSNPDSIVHDVMFKDPSFGVDATLQPGESRTVNFDTSKVGDFEFYCMQPGHEAAGMIGTLHVH